MSELKPWHKTWMVDLEYDRVDLVNEGANSQAHIKLFKSRGGKTMNLEEILKSLKPEHADVVRKALEQKDADAQALVEKAQKDAEEAVAKAKEESENAAPNPGTSEEEILKSVKDPAVRALLETQIAKTKAAEAQVLEAIEKERTNEAIAKAKEVPNLGADEQTMVDVYKKLKGVDAELCENVFGIFKAASAMINEGGLLTEVGKSSGGTALVSGDENAVWAKIEGIADEIAKTSKVSKSVAISTAIKDNPDLYAAYIKAQTGN